MQPVEHSLANRLAGRDDPPAFVENGKTVSRAQLRAASETAARGLAALGFKRGGDPPDPAGADLLCCFPTLEFSFDGAVAVRHNRS